MRTPVSRTHNLKLSISHYHMFSSLYNRCPPAEFLWINRSVSESVKVGMKNNIDICLNLSMQSYICVRTLTECMPRLNHDKSTIFGSKSRQVHEKSDRKLLLRAPCDMDGTIDIQSSPNVAAAIDMLGLQSVHVTVSVSTFMYCCPLHVIL
jgi:hypothetical protein